MASYIYSIQANHPVMRYETREKASSGGELKISRKGYIINPQWNNRPGNVLKTTVFSLILFSRNYAFLLSISFGVWYHVVSWILFAQNFVNSFRFTRNVNVVTVHIGGANRILENKRIEFTLKRDEEITNSLCKCFLNGWQMMMEIIWFSQVLKSKW